LKLLVYPNYKPSGVEWLGNVPEHWKVERLKYSATINDEALAETTDPGYEFRYVEISNVDAVNGIVAEDEMVFETAPSRARRVVRDGDTIVSTVRTYLRAIAPIRNPSNNLIVSTGFAVVRPRSAMPAFLSYALRESSFVETVVARSVGVSYPAVNASEVATIPIPLPPPAEQCAIADFLDAETTKLDTLVAKKRELIEKLKEKRTALISRTVTRGLPPEAARTAGLNPHPKFKPSGIEWLGEVPEHWEVLQLRRRWLVLDCKHRTVPFIDDGIPLASIQEVQGSEVDLSNAKQTTEEEYLEVNESRCVATLSTAETHADQALGGDEETAWRGVGKSPH
jgi:type I restriction enzyme, S subunit